ncbi:DUF6207 family protein [Streptomyces griseofuscus]|uniref:DUF6207 family protein n=1 Tax=Streptomyces griseofuscus TaxID=146922 RepID=UPI0033EAD356
MLAERWATAEHARRDPGEPGVRLRCYLDLRQPLDSQQGITLPITRSRANGRYR